MQDCISLLCQFLYKILIPNVTLYKFYFLNNTTEIIEGSRT